MQACGHRSDVVRASTRAGPTRPVLLSLGFWVIFLVLVVARFAFTCGLLCFARRDAVLQVRRLVHTRVRTRCQRACSRSTARTESSTRPSRSQVRDPRTASKVGRVCRNRLRRCPCLLVALWTLAAPAFSPHLLMCCMRLRAPHLSRRLRWLGRWCGYARHATHHRVHDLQLLDAGAC